MRRFKVKIVEGNLASMFDYYSGMLDERGMLKEGTYI
jgi:hypothetical protein